METKSEIQQPAIASPDSSPDSSPTQSPTASPEFKPAAPGEQQPEQKIAELDRAQLSEAWNETAAVRNALVALQADFKRLQAEQRTIEAESKIQEILGQQAQRGFNTKMEEIRQNYNIPDGYQIDAKTGLVSEAPPQPPVEQPEQQ